MPVSRSRQAEANRRNAQASTGPRSHGGKRRSAQNARRHGLSIPILEDPSWSEEVRTISFNFLPQDGNQELREFANRLAAAQLDVLRVKNVRHQMLRQLTRRLNKHDVEFDIDDIAHGLAQRFGSKRPAPRSLVKNIVSQMRVDIFGPDASECIQRILKLDRYERRAVSRRKRAMRDFRKAACRAD